MKKGNKFAALAALAVFSLALALSLFTGRRADAAAMQPFHAVVYVISTARFNGCIVTNNETGSGLALHLGKIEITTSETANIDPCPPPPLGPVTATVNSDFAMTAANGDEIHGVYTTQFTLDPSTGDVSAKGNFTFTSGTGRFSNVTGFGQITAYGATTGTSGLDVLGDAVGTFDGFIKYGGPKR